MLIRTIKGMWLMMEKYIHRLIDKYPFAIYECKRSGDGHFVFTYCSESIEQLLFVDPAELAEDGDAAWGNVCPVSGESVRSAFERSAETLAPVEIKFKVRTPEGVHLWVRCRGCPDREADESVVWNGFMEDITGSVQEDDEVKRRNSLLRNIFENLPDQIYYKDAMGRMVDANEACCDHHHTTPEKIRGKSDRDLYSGPRGEDAWEKEQRLMAEGAVLRQREVFGDDDGGTLYLDTVKIPLFSQSGRLLGLAGISRDVTAQVLGEQELIRAKQESEHQAAFIHAIFDNLDDQFYYKDTQSRVIGGNKAWVEHCGAESLDELIGKTDLELHPHPLGKQLYDGEQALIASGENLRIRECHKQEDGSVYYVESIKCPMKNDKGEVVGLAGISRDITAQVENENALIEARQAAEVANEAKSMFLAMMSHEIRTPMNGVIGASSLLSNTPLTPLQREFVRTINVSGENLLSLINDILDYSKIEAGKIVLEQVPFSLRTCIEDSFDLFTHSANKKNLELFHYIDPAIPETLVGDPSRLRQVIINLVGNAVKFTEKGEVGLRVVPVEGESDEDQCHLQVSVRDTGIGIPDEAKGNLFQAFTQVEGSSTRKYEGTGLGLTISRRIIELMGGQIWFESTSGEGTTFFFELNLPVSHESIESYKHPVSPAILAGKRALIVDDNETNRWLLGDQLAQWAMEPHSFSSPQEALLHLEEGHVYDIALLDFNMPEMDGRELAQAIHNRLGEARFPVVILSSSCENFGSDPAIDGWLSKPFKQEHLREQLVRVLSFLPRADAREAEPATTHVQVRKNYDLRILVAEDNSVNRRVVKMMLERLGYGNATIVPDGEEAVAAVIDVEFDVVLMDVQMPGMDGLEAARQIRAHTGSQEKPWIIALTAGVMDEERSAALAAGMNEFLAKPLKVDVLEQVLDQVRKTLDKANPSGTSSSSS